MNATTLKNPARRVEGDPRIFRSHKGEYGGWWGGECGEWVGFDSLQDAVDYYETSPRQIMRVPGKGLMMVELDDEEPCLAYGFVEWPDFRIEPVKDPDFDWGRLHEKTSPVGGTKTVRKMK